MYEYIFLFVVSIIWLVFASVQDLRTKEVSNWLNFSLVGLGLAYRLFYSVQNKDYGFFVWGVFAVIIFFGISQVFYYGRVFGGGDAKLLVGIVSFLPFSNFNEFVFQGGVFLLVLFSVGAICSLVTSFIFAYRNKRKFYIMFSKINKEFNWKFYISLFIVVLLILGKGYDWFIGSIFFILMLFVSYLLIYLHAVDKSCMLVYVKPRDLREGDWIGEEITIKGRKIGASVHGLSFFEINKLIKRGKKVLIKQGVPFIPVFLFSYIIMLFFFFYDIQLQALFLQIFQF
jgi:Flp pilus assembly protein protease CpaA